MSSYAPLTGYTDRLSATASEVVQFKISSEQSFRADLVKIVHGDPNPSGPGLKYIPLESSFTGEYPACVQETNLGSYGITEPSDVSLSFPISIGATIWPTLLSDQLEFQCILSRIDEKGRGFMLGINKSKCLELRLRFGNEAEEHRSVSTGKAMRERAWYDVVAIVEHDKITVWQHSLKPEFGVDDSGIMEEGVPGTTKLKAFSPLGPFVIAACQSSLLKEKKTRFHFNGKIENPFIIKKALSLEQEHPLAKVVQEETNDVVAWWDFSIGIETQIASDVGRSQFHAKLINTPTRAMTGSMWSGREMCFRHAPMEYAAIHFHEDDIYDCGWDTTFSLEIPENMSSGVYGARLNSGEYTDIIPVFVRPKVGEPGARILYLASTFTYQIYANHVRLNSDKSYFERAREWKASLVHPDQYYRCYGASTYNRHSDGSGICFSSRLRPILTMRPGFLTFNDPRGSGLRHFPADTHLLDWLDATGQAFDVITDEDLHSRGYDMLAPYNVVLTGSHPEYHTEETIEALKSYTDKGGRLMYLGGNGFYWKIACSPQLPGMLEIRRGEGGIRAWSAEPGEYYNALDGTYGGLWRRNGRPPQSLVGVGFSSQGLFDGSFYQRTEASYEARFKWVFDGIDDNKVGHCLSCTYAKLLD